MEEFLKEGLEGNDLVELNRCGILQKATCVSEISTGDEKRTSITEWNGIKNTASSRYE